MGLDRVVLVGLLAGCVDTASVTCADGRRCPIATACDDVHAGCVLPDQLAQCADKADDTPCTIASRPGACDRGVCLPTEVCGDGVATGSEDCDGADVRDGRCTDLGYHDDTSELGCTVICTFDGSQCGGPRCGDGIVDLDDGEQCDSAPNTSVAQCEDPPFLFYDPGAVTCNALCLNDASGCTGWCGDGIIDAPHEVCDGAPAPGASCLDFGMDAGRLDCGVTSCGASIEACRFVGWGTAASIPATSVTDVVGRAADDLFAVTLTGLILHFDGALWTAVDDISGSVFDAWQSTSSTDLWLVGGGGIGTGTGTALIWHRTAGMTNEVHANATQGTELRSVVGLSSGIIIAVGLNGTAYRRTGTWSNLASGTTEHLFGVWADSTAGAYIVGSNVLLRYQSNGAIVPMTLPVATASLRAVWGVESGSALDLYAVGASGVILHGDGASWTTMASPTAQTLVSVWGRGRDDVFAVGANGTIIHYDGISWMPMVSPDRGPLRGLWGLPTVAPGIPTPIAISDTGSFIRYRGSSLGTVQSPPSVLPGFAASWGEPDDLYAVGSRSVYHFDGTAWTEVHLAATPLRGIAGTGTGKLYAVGDGGTIAYFDGAAWTETVAPGGTDLRGVWATATTAFIVGASGVILRGLGTVVTAMSSPVSTALRGVYGFSDGDVVAVGTGGVVLRFDGTTWSQVASPVSVELDAAWGTGPNDVFAVGAAGTIVHHDGTSWTATRVAPLEDLHAVAGTAADDVFAIGEHGAIVHFDGTGWGPLRSRQTLSLTGLALVARRVVMVGRDVLSGNARWEQISRTLPWSCRSSETSCADGVDDDCDGAIDAADLMDCPP